MEKFGSQHIGSIKIERVSTLPRFSDPDIGRCILVEDRDCVYFGCMTGWIPVVGKSYITPDQLDLGSTAYQINANTFPLLDINFFSNIGNTIEEVLKKIIDGTALSDNSILNRHVADKSISLFKLQTGYTLETINSSTIPYYEHLSKKPLRSITDALNEFMEQVPQIYNISVDLIDWDFDPNNNYFIKTFRDYPFLNMPIVQCYDENGKLFKDYELFFDCTERLISITVLQTIKLNVVFIGS